MGLISMSGGWLVGFRRYTGPHMLVPFISESHPPTHNIMDLMCFGFGTDAKGFGFLVNNVVIRPICPSGVLPAGRFQ